MMEFLSEIWTYLFSFILVLTVLVFVHELGHYLAARTCGIRIEVFSVGFGPEIYGFTDKLGTRWKLSIIPFGGYVKMFGEIEPEPNASGSPLNDVDAAVSFFNKSLRKRAWVVLAGPLANFLFAIVVLTGLFVSIGFPYFPAEIAKVSLGSAAERAGLKPYDKILKINSTNIQSFEEMRKIVENSANIRLKITIKRNEKERILFATPKPVVIIKKGSKEILGRLGISRSTENVEFVPENPILAAWKASLTTINLTGEILYRIFSGRITKQDLGGPIRIAQLSGDMAQAGIGSFCQFVAILSINLGLINLFPIPLLDGGHLFFYMIEALRGKPVDQKIMGYSLNFGLALILCLTLFVTWNDLVKLNLF